MGSCLWVIKRASMEQMKRRERIFNNSKRVEQRWLVRGISVILQEMVGVGLAIESCLILERCSICVCVFGGYGYGGGSGIEGLLQVHSAGRDGKEQSVWGGFKYRKLCMVLLEIGIRFNLILTIIPKRLIYRK